MKKNQSLNLRITEVERVMLEMLSENKGQSMTDVLKFALWNEFKKIYGENQFNALMIEYLNNQIG